MADEKPRPWSYHSAVTAPAATTSAASTFTSSTIDQETEPRHAEPVSLSTPSPSKEHNDPLADIPLSEPIATGLKDVEAVVAENEKSSSISHSITPKDPNVVDWDGPDDPATPMNWPNKKKWINIAIISFVTFLTPLASSMVAPGIPLVMREFHSTNATIASFIVSIYILGYAIGPLFLAPLSEVYGRLPVYHGCNFMFVVWSIACALSPDIASLLIFRLFQGLAGSCPLTIGGGSIADVIPQQQRGGAMAVFAMGPLLGPVIGPVAGGYLSAAAGWRWTFWLVAIAGGFVLIVSGIYMRETYEPVLLEKKAAKLRKETGNPDLRSKLDSGIPRKEFFIRALIRPTKMLLFSPIVLSMSIYMATVYGYLYLLFTTLTSVYEEIYHFSQGAVGLSYLGIGIGSFAGLIIFGAMSDRILKRLAAKSGEMKPEYRLPPLIPGSLCVPIGLFWYGWSAEKQIHWIMPIIGTAWVGVGMLATFMSLQTYMIDSYTVYAASAVAANTVFRSLLGALIPLAGPALYESLGLGWGNSLLGFIALAMAPISVVFWKYGETIRKHPRFQMQF